MKIFLAGAGGAIGRRLTPLLRAAGHAVVGTTRSADKADAIRALGAEPVVVDVFDAEALARAVKAAAPQAIIHQLTDLAFAPGTPQYQEGLARNARLRIEGTRNLVAAARAANVKRMIAQSIAFYLRARRGCARRKRSPDRRSRDGRNRGGGEVAGRGGAVAAGRRRAALRLSLRPRHLVAGRPRQPPAVHIDAAAQAALLALTRGKRGIYNIAEDDPALSSEKAKREFGFDAGFRIKS